MTLTAGDMAAITGMMASITTVLGVIVRYFVKSEIKIAVDGLRLEWAKERSATLEGRLAASAAALHITESA